MDLDPPPDCGLRVKKSERQLVDGGRLGGHGKTRRWRERLDPVGVMNPPVMRPHPSRSDGWGLAMSFTECRFG